MLFSDEFIDAVNATNMIFGTLIFEGKNIENIIRLFGTEAKKNGLSINLPSWHRIALIEKFI